MIKKVTIKKILHNKLLNYYIYALRRKNCCINQPDCWYRTDKTFLLSQKIFSFPNKPIC